MATYFDLKLDKSKKYLLACSYGPDSMFLFHHLKEEGYNFVAAFVNYHKRFESNREETELTSYCQQCGVPLEKLSVDPKDCKGNFQTWAREVRYAFFEELYKKHNIDALLVGHHLDDLLETYLIQQKRGGYYAYYGIKEETYILGMKVIRPMLAFSKKEIYDFDYQYAIPFSIDYSNLRNDYQRNKYRNTVLNKYSSKQKAQLLKEIARKNEENQKLIEKAKLVINDRNFIRVKQALELTKDEFAFVLFGLMSANNIYTPISKKQIISLRECLDSGKANIKVKLSKDISYYQEYDEIRILRNRNPYSYVIETPSLFECDDFVVDLRNAGEDRNIHFEDFPITIRTVRKDDKYLVKDYYVKVNRLFIDWKMPLHLRAVWPIVCDKDDKIIYIPRYHRVFIDRHKTLFKISLK